MAELIEHSIPFNFEMAIGNVEADSGGKFYYLSGIATDNLPDKQNQRFSKTFIFRFCKAWEVLVMLLGCFAFYLGNIPLLYFTLFMMGMQSAFFGPGKYGIVPELLPEGRLVKANGIILMTTYLAITLGTASSGLLKDALEDDGGLYRIQGFLVLLAVLGTLAALGIRRMPVAQPELAIRGKLFGDLRPTLVDIFADRSFRSVALTYAYFWGLGA